MNRICHYILHWVEKNLYERTTIDELVKTTGYSRRTL
ncbi:transcriptional regulator, partial [Salmonella enterica]|nr:transcriptional regulator [Salmonella enterica]